MPTFWRRQKLRAKCGVLSARSAPERAGSRRVRPIGRAFSPCEINTVRFSGLSALWAAFAQPSPSRDRKLNLNQSCLSVRERPRQIDAAENRTLLHAESVALRRPFERQIDAVEQRLGVLLPLADRFHDWGCSERQAPLRFLRSGAELWLTNVLVFSLGNRLRVAAFNVRRRGGTQR